MENMTNKNGEQKEPVKIWEAYKKLTIVLKFKSR